LNGANVTVKAEVLENGTSYDYVSNSRSTIPFNYYTTPDTKYEEKAPSGFKVPSLPNAASNYATWSEYVYQNGTFVLKNYGIGISGTSTATLTPASGNSAEKDASGKWTMKSGYVYGLKLPIQSVLYPVSDAFDKRLYKRTVRLCLVPGIQLSVW
jgi:hypothetical protein